jgi:endonuclease/exonuclease/phosphatase family metal-dependent hydrolase
VHLRVASWNLFHGRSQPAVRGDLLPAFAGALGAHAWDVCALQEVPPWWPAELGRRLGASVRTTRTSLLRASLPAAQAAVHRRDPEVIGVRGAAVNVLLVRPSAGVIVDHRAARLRRAPQRRTMHGVKLATAGGERVWVVNLHAHNRPEQAAERDVRLAIDVARGWATSSVERDAGSGAVGHGDARTTPLVLVGDLNLKAPPARELAASVGLTHVHGDHVDQIVTLDLARVGRPFAHRMHLAPGGPALSDHRFIGATLST